MIFPKVQKRHVILTGGPGGGKSSLLEVLREKGYVCVDEVARDLIKEEVARKGEALPWKDAEKFRDRMFEAQLKACARAPIEGTVFFDRGPIDCIAYSHLEGISVPEKIQEESRKIQFYKKVFATPPWEEIYKNDAERKQSFQEAVDTYEQIVATYREYGYEVVVLPKAHLEKRVDFLLEEIHGCGRGEETGK